MEPAPSASSRLSVHALWFASLTGIGLGLLAVVPEWMGMSGPASILARAATSAEGSAAPIIAAVSVFRVLVDLVYVLWLALLGFGSALAAALGRDPVERFGGALLPFALSGLTALALSLLAPKLHELLGPSPWTLVSAACSGLIAGALTEFGTRHSVRNPPSSRQ